MTSNLTDKNCGRIRGWLYKAVNSRINLDSTWLQNHIAHCPRCQKRLATVSRIDLAISLIRSEPCRLDLLMRANSQAIGVLKRSLRDIPKAQKLKTIHPEPGLVEKLGHYKGSIANAAACILIFFVIKAGVFSSMEQISSQGQKTMKEYYAKSAGQDIADEVFSA